MYVYIYVCMCLIAVLLCTVAVGLAVTYSGLERANTLFTEPIFSIHSSTVSFLPHFIMLLLIPCSRKLRSTWRYEGRMLGECSCIVTEILVTDTACLTDIGLQIESMILVMCVYIYI